MSEVLELTRALIRAKSITPDDADTLRTILEYLGPDFKYEWLNFEDTKNLFITHGSGSPHLMFLGHVDVVPPGNEKEWTSPPFDPAIRDGKLYGRGACDMKSAVAAMAIALKRYVALNQKHAGMISLLLTSDEEGSNKNAIPKVVEVFQKRNLSIDYCLVGEPSSKDALADNIKVGRRGSLSGTLIVKGQQGHIAYPHLAKNPIHIFAPALKALTEHQWDQGNEHFQPTSLQFSNISAGTGTTNIIPAELRAQFNFRFSTEQTSEGLMRKFEDFLREHKVEYDLSWSLGGQPFLTKGGKLLESILKSISIRFNISAKLDTGGGTSDGRFIAPLGTEVVELGLRGESMHKVDEFVRVDELEPLAMLYQDIAVSLL